MDYEGLLLLQVREGNEKAFETFVERFWKPVFSLTYRFTGSAQDSEDLCQEIFMRVYNHVNEFRGEGKAFTWLYRIAVNTCLNWKRKQKVVPFPINEQDHDPHHSTSQEALLSLELKDAFSTLSNSDRMLILLRKFYGFSYEEIGKMLSISSIKVKGRLHEAKTRLAQRLNPILEGGQSWTAPQSNHN